jgi:hypothetical protein
MINVAGIPMSLALARLIIIPALMDWNRRHRLRRISQAARLRNPRSE